MKKYTTDTHVAVKITMDRKPLQNFPILYQICNASRKSRVKVIRTNEYGIFLVKNTSIVKVSVGGYFHSLHWRPGYNGKITFVKTKSVFGHSRSCEATGYVFGYYACNFSSEEVEKCKNARETILMILEDCDSSQSQNDNVSQKEQ